MLSNFNLSTHKGYGQANVSGLYARLSLFVGCDEYGEPSPACMYYDLWINNPTCNNEYPDYTYEEHFGKILPSYVPRAVVRDYLEGKILKSANGTLMVIIV